MIDIKQIDDEITRRIKNRINEKGYSSQREFCNSIKNDGINFDEPFLTDIFKGKRRTIDNMIILSNKLNTSLDYLVGISDVSEVNEDYKMINEITHLSEKTINNLSNNFDEEQIEIINFLLENYYSLNFLYNLTEYFKFDRYADSSTFIIHDSLNNMKIIEDNGMIKIETEGYVDDFYDGFNGKYRINNDKYERLILENIVEDMKKFKSHSSTEITYIENKIKRLEESISENQLKKRHAKRKKLIEKNNRIAKEFNEKYKDAISEGIVNEYTLLNSDTDTEFVKSVEKDIKKYKLLLEEAKTIDWE